MKLGFNKTDFIVIILIVIVLTTVVWSALNSARAKARDVKRVRDVKYIQEALELYYNDNSDYPSLSSAGQEARPDESACTEDRSRFKCYMPEYPTYPRPIDGQQCVHQTGYVYNKLHLSDGGYSITFCLGSEAEGLGAGPHIATANGIK